MKIQNNKNLWFTLVELIVTITILAILASIWFVSYPWYLAGSRDTNRLSQLKSISDWLQLYLSKNTLPIPDDYIEIQTNSKTIAYQDYAWINVLETIEYSSVWDDPKDKTYYTYYLTKDKKDIQLMWYLEE
jgi:prepilin-type N-terminal cleavage/methylation domain-containing protein